MCDHEPEKPSADLLNGGLPFSNTGPQIDFALSQMREPAHVWTALTACMGSPDPNALQVWGSILQPV